MRTAFAMRQFWLPVGEERDCERERERERENFSSASRNLYTDCGAYFFAEITILPQVFLHFFSAFAPKLPTQIRLGNLVAS